MITISNQATSCTAMHAHSERLADLCPAGTRLTCATRIDLHQQPTSIYRFVGKHVYEVVPSSIIDGLAQPATSKPFYIEILDSDQAVLIYELSRFFVMKVTALIADMVMKSRQKYNGFATAIRSLLPARYPALQAPQLGLPGTEPSRIFDLRTIAKRRERSQANVDTNHVGIEGQRIRFTLDNEQRKPSASFAPYRQCLNLTLEWSVQFDPNVSNLRQPQFISAECFTYPSKRKTVVTPRRSESRVARPLSSLETTKECLKRKVNALERFLQGVRANIGYILADLPDFRYLIDLIEQRDRFAFDGPRVAALLQRRVIQLTANSKLMIQGFCLMTCGIDTVSKRADHLHILTRRFSLANR